jgi:aryl-alcohol dehydrogenase-like predicted oxidoreductase
VIVGPRPLGATGLFVSPLGLGGGALGDPAMEERDIEALFASLAELDVTLVDAARSYGLAEERIGRYLEGHRERFVLSTKGGYGVDGVEDWTRDAIVRGIDEALVRLRTSFIDVFHLHSCPLDVLRREDILRPLDDARQAGKIRVAAYSGEGDALAWAIESGRFGSVQCSVNVFDQRSLEAVIPRAAKFGVGVIAKRPLANAPWQYDVCPRGQYVEPYWERMKKMRIDAARDFGMTWVRLLTRFSAYAYGVSAVIVGTANPQHLFGCASSIDRGPLPADVEYRVRAAFAENDDGWIGQI